MKITDAYFVLVLVGSMAYPLAAGAVVQEDFVIRKADDLVDVCAVAPDEPLYQSAIHFCHGDKRRAADLAAAVAVILRPARSRDWPQRLSGRRPFWRCRPGGGSRDDCHHPAAGISLPSAEPWPAGGRPSLPQLKESMGCIPM
ncbi:MAG: hypothetical protein ACREYC_15090, partial [Gammaproteobacteria bacterium]